LKQAQQLGDGASEVNVLRKLADSYYIGGKFKEAQLVEDKLCSCPAYKVTIKQMCQNRLDSISKSATFCQEHGQPERAEELLKLAAKTAETKFGAQSESYRNAVLALAGFYASHKQSTKLQMLFARDAKDKPAAK
jgi:hypothetical protein